jgi:Tol biopolymer transport system component
MKPEKWKAIEEIYHHAQQCGAAERASFLDQACASDEELRHEVESLLRANDRAESFLGMPALNLAAQMIAEDRSRSMEGKRVSHYEIGAQIGAGGMGEVYRARDIRLNREVAIKVLPANLSQNADALVRFEREAMAVAALSHPNILAIHDFGKEQGVTFAVTELLEGETLRNRLSHSQLTWRKCVEIAVAVCDGLSAAHAKGIIHRDLKPENIFVTRDGNVKVLDFGLARMKAASISSVANTVATSGNITVSGAVIGTVGYMSPEQVRGEKVEAASDIFSLGCVLYEMLVGRRPFVGETMPERMAAVLRDDPRKPSAARKDLPEALEQVITRCLQKRADERYQSGRELASDLKRILSNEDSITQSMRPAFRRSVWTLSALALLLIIAVTYWRTRSGQLPSTSNASVEPLKTIPLTTYDGIELFPSFSPDGTQMTFVWDGPSRDNLDIYTRSVQHGTPLRLTTHPAEDISPAWSPDGRFIAFLRYLPDGKAGIFLTTPLSRAERLLTEIAAPRRRVGFWGPHLTWSPDSKWITTVDKSSADGSSELFLISVESGEKLPISLPSAFAGAVLSPTFSPDGRSLAFIRVFGFFVSELYVVALTDNREVRGEPIQLTFFKNHRTASPVWSRDGREIIFVSGAGWSGRLYRIGVVEPGKPQRIESVLEEVHNLLAISHSGQILGYVQSEWDSNIWRLQLDDHEHTVGTPSSLISSTRQDNNPQFSPDGRQVAFTSDRSGDREVWVSDSDGSNARQLTSFGGIQTDCVRWSPDGERLVFQTYPEGHLDIFLINVRGGRPERLTHEISEDNLPSWSRDGRWIYFTSTRSGSMQVWKMLTDGSGAVQLTRGGGFGPLESADGKTLYYAKSTPRGLAVWRVPVDGEEEVEVLAGISDWSNYLPTNRGIYFTPFTEPGEAASIRFFNFADGKIKTVATLPKPVFLGLTISPDGRSLLYTQLDHRGFDLMLVENFR